MPTAGLGGSASPSASTLLRPHLDRIYRERGRRAYAGPLTARQQQSLGLVAAGHTNTQIARRLSVSEATVRKHLENIFDRPQVSSRTAAVVAAFGEGGPAEGWGTAREAYERAVRHLLGGHIVASAAGGRGHWPAFDR